MINERRVRKYCRDELSKIENYDKAIADKTTTWHLHHRLELTLDGEPALTVAQLKMHDMYYNRPYYELIFLTPTEHRRLHSMNMSEDTKQRISESLKGQHPSEETKKKMSEAKKGRTFSDETRRKICEMMKGKKRKPFTEEHRRKMSEAAKRRWAEVKC